MFNKRTFLVIILFLQSFNPVRAVDLSLSSAPENIDVNTEFNITAFLGCNKCGDSYLRGVFYKDSNDYFGFTLNNNQEWIGTSNEKTKYFQIKSDEIQDGSWSGQIKLKPDKENKYYVGSGSYSLKLIRYTSSGNKSTESNIVSVNIQSEPTQTPKPTPTTPPTLHPTLLPTSTKIPSPTSRPLPSSVPTPISTLTSSPTGIPPAPTSETLQKVLSASTESSPSKFGKILILAGITGIGLSAVMLILPKKDEK